MNIIYIAMGGTKFDNRSHEIRVAEKMAEEGNNVFMITERVPRYGIGEKPKNLQIFSMPLNERSMRYQLIGFGNRITHKHMVSLDKMLGGIEFDAIFSSSASGAELALKLKKKYGGKTIIQILDIPMWLLKNKNARIRISYRYRWKKWCSFLLKVDRLIVNNKITIEELPEAINLLKLRGKIPDVHYVKYGITTHLLNKIPGYEEQDQMIFLSRLVKHKGVDLLLKAVSLAKNAPKLVVLGDGEERENLEKISKKLGINVEFKGGVSEEQKVIGIKKSKFMIYTSTTESISGIAPNESLYCEKPCICFDIRVLRDNYNDYVEYVPRGDLKELAKKIDELNSRPSYRKRRGRDGKKYIINNLTTDVHAEQILNIMKQLVDK